MPDQESNADPQEQPESAVKNSIESANNDEKPQVQALGTVDATKKFKKRPSKKQLIIILIALVVLAGGGATYYFLKVKNKPEVAQQNQVDNQPQEEETALKPISATDENLLLQRFTNPTTGETWLPASKKLADQGFRKPTDYETSAEYYEVGARGDKTIIMIVESGLGDYIQLFEKSKDGKVTYVARPDADVVYDEGSEKDAVTYLNDNVAVDKSIHYDSLTIPRKLPIEHGYNLLKPIYVTLGDLIRPSEPAATLPQVTPVKQVGFSKITKQEFGYADTKLTSIGYVLNLPIGTRVFMTYEPIEVELKGYQWQRGNYTDDVIRAIARGCGGMFTSVTRADTVTDSDVLEVGKAPSGQKAYELKDENHILLQKAYEEFKEFASQSTDIKYASISKQDFVKEHGIVLHKDKFGQWLVYARDELRPAYGCAKPVVYLYPQSAQQVSVRVGADVKVSAPHYSPSSGWNALAFPNGQLLVEGNWYDSLFWEGPGHGAYPSITTGTVVPTEHALETIRQQLNQLGLNEKESSDFIEYWHDQLPDKPYTRLTWITTADMNQLAPLQITPKPDTLIRVFLDFAGLDQPLDIPAQQLTAAPRNGFTVVEWGGLSGRKLY